jgi:16S rRNA G966 N2-methylase RsmD
VRADAMRFLRSMSEQYDLIFADPPYAFEETTAIPNIVFHEKLLKHHGYLLIEHEYTLQFITTTLYHAGPAKRFGRTMITFFRHQQELP